MIRREKMITSIAPVDVYQGEVILLVRARGGDNSERDTEIGDGIG